MTIRPLRDYVVIRRVPDVRVGRIVVPDGVDTKPRVGVIEAVGPGRRVTSGAVVPLCVQVGDRVSFSLDGGFVVRLDGERHADARLLIREADVVAILAPESEVSAVGSVWPSYITDGVQG